MNKTDLTIHILLFPNDIPVMSQNNFDKYFERRWWGQQDINQIDDRMLELLKKKRQNVKQIRGDPIVPTSPIKKCKVNDEAGSVWAAVVTSLGRALRKRPGVLYSLDRRRLLQPNASIEPRVRSPNRAMPAQTNVIFD